MPAGVVRLGEKEGIGTPAGFKAPSVPQIRIFNDQNENFYFSSLEGDVWLFDLSNWITSPSYTVCNFWLPLSFIQTGVLIIPSFLSIYLHCFCYFCCFFFLFLYLLCICVNFEIKYLLVPILWTSCTSKSCVSWSMQIYS